MRDAHERQSAEMPRIMTAQQARPCIYGRLIERLRNDLAVDLALPIYAHINPYGHYDIDLDARIDFDRQAA